MQTPRIDGFADFEELGRSSLVAGYRAKRGNKSWVVEVLLTDHERAVQEFYRTSTLATRLTHPGMPPIQAMGRSEGKPFRVREYVEGRPVSALFGEGPLPQERLLTTARALASVVDALHRRSHIHAELGPHGLRVDSAGQTRFLDPGRAWPVGRPLPEPNKMLSLAYQAPENEAGTPARPESDVYSLGACLIALATGRPAKEREGLAKADLSHLSPALRVLLKSMILLPPAERPSSFTVHQCFQQLEELDALMKLKAWRPTPSAQTYMGDHAYPLMGRETELARLMSLWHLSLKEPGKRVLLTGPKGSGRRRLLEELKRGVERSGGRYVSHRSQIEEGNPSLLVSSQESTEPTRCSLEVVLTTQERRGPSVIALEPADSSICLRLAEAYLASPLPATLSQEIRDSGPRLPGEMLALLDTWCESGFLRPDWLGWVFERSPGRRRKPEKGSVDRVESNKREFAPEQRSDELLELWATATEQDEPLTLFISSLCTTLGARKVDLYRFERPFLRYLEGSSPGAARLCRTSADRVLETLEPELTESTLLFPLRFGYLAVGLLNIEWWTDHAPEKSRELLRFLQSASVPLSFFLSQHSVREQSDIRFAEALADLADSSPEPGEVLGSLSKLLELCCPAENCSVWLARDNELQLLITRASTERDSAHGSYLSRCEGPLQKKSRYDTSLYLPLRDAKTLLGGIVLTRGVNQGFQESEKKLASGLVKIAQGSLRNARLYGEQNRLLKKTKHRFLAAQIKPHFLFNALNTIASLIALDPEKAEDLVMDTADFLRTTFMDGPEVVTVQHELDFLETYLRLEKARFGDKLKVDLEVEPDVLSVKLPALTLQPLVENAVRHGVTARAEGGTIRLRASQVQGLVEVVVEDDGVGFEVEGVRPTGTGVGLANVRERIRDYSGDLASWSLQSKPGAGTRICFRLPLARTNSPVV